MKRAAIAVLFLSLISALGSTRPVAGYPIPPQTLWEQVKQSKLVVLAEVTQVKERTARSDDDWDSATALLRILATFKGKSAATLAIDYPANLLCPAPPRYVEHKEVLAFLEREKGRWQTVGLSYGTLYPGKGLGDYREMIRRAVDLQSRGRVSEADRIDWLVEAAARPATRWHGLYPLEPDADELNSFYDRNRKPLWTALSPEQVRRIADGFISTPPTDRTLPMALALFRNLPSREIDEAALSAIEGLLAEESTPWWIDQAFAAVFARYGEKETTERLSALEKLKLCFDEDMRSAREQEVRAIWRQAKQDLGIPEVLPAFADSRDVGGVGSDTPD
jgi:hypothetical protein